MCDLKIDDRASLQARLIYWVRTGKIVWKPSEMVPEYSLLETLEARRLKRLKGYGSSSGEGGAGN